MHKWWDTVRNAFEDIRWDLLDVQGSDDRGVNHFRMSGTLGGATVQQTMWQAVKLREGKATCGPTFAPKPKRSTPRA